MTDDQSKKVILNSLYGILGWRRENTIRGQTPDRTEKERREAFTLSERENND